MLIAPSMNSSCPKDRAVFRPTGFADLTGKRVGIFGYGVEGRATERRLQGLSELVIVDDNASDEPNVLATSGGGLEALLHCNVVLKSPGIPRRRADVLDLERHGVTVTSALNLWLHETERSRVVALTGTKGKSTTTALVTFFLHCLGEDAQRLGNIGQPPYDPSLDTSKGWLVLEVSSFQCVDLDVAPAVVVVTSLGSDHLDWHGSLEQYHNDKLSLTRAEGEHRTLVPDIATFHQIQDQLGGELIFVESDTSDLARELGLIGAHNNANVALALAVATQLTGVTLNEVRSAVKKEAHRFEPLRGRLTLVATETLNGSLLRYIDDGLATSVLPTVAALEVFRDEPIALIAGGFDRGVDYDELAKALSARVEFTTLITMGDAGKRLAEALLPHSKVVQRRASDMVEAVELARTSLDHGGVVLLSPAAPSFDHYKNWEERSEHFSAIVRSLIL
jgi:UDP-N-acetylmuramoylalanine--D-glutamate ligase